jgi:hypothetical protein
VSGGGGHRGRCRGDRSCCCRDRDQRRRADSIQDHGVTPHGLGGFDHVPSRMPPCPAKVITADTINGPGSARICDCPPAASSTAGAGARYRPLGRGDPTRALRRGRRSASHLPCLACRRWCWWRPSAGGDGDVVWGGNPAPRRTPRPRSLHDGGRVGRVTSGEPCSQWSQDVRYSPGGR